MQKMHLFSGMTISAEINRYAGYPFLSWDSSFGTVTVLPLLVLVALQSVLIVLQLSSGYCMCVLERPFVIYLL